MSTQPPAETIPAKPKGTKAPPPTADSPKAPEPPAPKVLSYWRKELASNAFFISGKAAPFEFLEGNRGVLALDPQNPTHVPLIEELTLAAKEQRGGIRRSSQNEYETLKKTYPPVDLTKSGQRSQDEKLRIAPRAGMQGKAFRPPPPKGISAPKPAAPASTETPAPPAEDVVDGVPQGPNPTPDYVPRVGRVGDVNKTPNET